jgi:hypothetical protein
MRRRRAEQRAEHDSKFFVLEANQLFDRIEQRPPEVVRKSYS